MTKFDKKEITLRRAFSTGNFGRMNKDMNDDEVRQIQLKDLLGEKE